MLYSLVLLAFATVINADCYLHNPRGSNNRLNEQSANRNNGDRLFDSQNNNRGGYNVGDKNDDAANGATSHVETFTLNTDQATQYQMMFYEGSKLQFEWTNQHGCGGSEVNDTQKLNCNLVIQYMCDVDRFNNNNGAVTIFSDHSMTVDMRDGATTNTIEDADNFAEVDDDPNPDRGRHESRGWYYHCEKRFRNKGLFHADQNLNGDAAKYTRQNPNGNRRGLECPEERDYYPYWHVTPWIDAAYLTDDLSFCQTVMAGNQNNNTVGYCDGLIQNDETVPITESACTAKSGIWKTFNKGLPAPDCAAAGWSRTNHLGNGRDTEALKYDWALPMVDDLISTGNADKATGQQTDDFLKCVVRVRYNMTTDDYDPKMTTSAMDDDEDNGFFSPVRQNPEVDVGLTTLQGLKLAVNTAQFGRTFQDRSHIFYIKKRPDPTKVEWANSNIYNLNIRGKRCNIVQCFPAVEYDYIPRILEVSPGDAIHLQWTGSNTHNNGNPAGDGQAGDAGEGTGGTDRGNWVQTLPGAGRGTNYPLPLDKFTDNIFTRANFWQYDYAEGETLVSGPGSNKPWVNAALILATSGQFRSANDPGLENFQELLNDAPASLVGGMMIHFPSNMALSPNLPENKEEITYMNTRNNNFSNRSQKGVIVLKPKSA